MARRAVETVSTGCKPLRSSKAFTRGKQVDDKKGKKHQETGHKESAKDIAVDELPSGQHDVQIVDYATISALVSSDNIGPNPPMRSAGRDVSPGWKSSPPTIYAANGHRIRVDREKMPPSSSDLKLARLLSNAHRAPLANRKLSRPTWPANNGYDLTGAVTSGSPYVRRPAKGLPTGKSSFDVQTDQGKYKQVHGGFSKGHSCTTRSKASGTAFRSKPFVRNISGLAYGRCGDPCHPCLESENATGRNDTGNICSIEVFRREWKKMSEDSNGRFQLLRRVVPCDFPRIFRHEIPPGVLGEILETLWDWQLTQVRCASPEVGQAGGQTPNTQVLETPVSHQRSDQAPSKSCEEFVSEFVENLETAGLEELNTSLNKQRVADIDPLGRCPAKMHISNAKSRAPGKKPSTRTALPSQSDIAQLSSMPRGVNHVSSISSARFGRILEEKESQFGSDKMGSTRGPSSEWSKDMIGPMNGRQRLHKNLMQQLIIQPCENLRKFDEVLSRCGILNSLVHENPGRDQLQPAAIPTANVNTDPPCSSGTDFTLVEASSGDVGNLKFDGRGLSDGTGSLATDEQHGSQNSTGHTSARSVSFRTDNYLDTADTDQHSHATERGHIVWLFDVLKAITKCGRFTLALKMMGEKARFIVATLLDHFAAGILIEHEELRSCDVTEGISKEQEVLDSAPAHNHGAITPENGLHSGGCTLGWGDLNPAQGDSGRTSFRVEQLRELRTLYRIDMQ